MKKYFKKGITVALSLTVLGGCSLHESKPVEHNGMLMHEFHNNASGKIYINDFNGNHDFKDESKDYIFNSKLLHEFHDNATEKVYLNEFNGIQHFGDEAREYVFQDLTNEDLEKSLTSELNNKDLLSPNKDSNTYSLNASLEKVTDDTISSDETGVFEFKREIAIDYQLTDKSKKEDNTFKYTVINFEKVGCSMPCNISDEEKNKVKKEVFKNNFILFANMFD